MLSGEYCDWKENPGECWSLMCPVGVLMETVEVQWCFMENVSVWCCLILNTSI